MNMSCHDCAPDDDGGDDDDDDDDAATAGAAADAADGAVHDVHFFETEQAGMKPSTVWIYVRIWVLVFLCWSVCPEINPERGPLDNTWSCQAGRSTVDPAESEVAEACC